MGFVVIKSNLPQLYEQLHETFNVNDLYKKGISWCPQPRIEDAVLEVFRKRDSLPNICESLYKAISEASLMINFRDNSNAYENAVRKYEESEKPLYKIFRTVKCGHSDLESLLSFLPYEILQKIGFVCQSLIYPSFKDVYECSPLEKCLRQFRLPLERKFENIFELKVADVQKTLESHVEN